ncbi:MAG: type IV secretory system conjugative DNA transfer family protein [Lautropia sp.]
MKKRQAAIAGGIVAYVVLGAVAVAYLSGLFLFVANKVWPTGLSWDTWYAMYQNIDSYPHQAKAVKGSMGVALALVYVIGPLLIAAATQRPRSLHGDARFARADEVRKRGLMTDKPGIVVGRMNGRYLIFPGQQFVLMAAPTRSGKGVGVVIPNLLNWPESVVVTDIKGENFAITSGFRKAHGQEVYLFAPFAEDGRTHRWNPFDMVSRDPAKTAGELLAIAQALYPTGGPDTKSSFWNEQAQNVFLGLSLYLMETPGRACNFGELYAEGSGRGQPVRAHLTGILEAQAVAGALSATCQESLSRVISMSNDTLASVMATFNGPLLIYANAFVAAATSGSDFSLSDVRRRCMSIYLVIPPSRLADAAVLLNLFYSQLVTLNTHELPSADSTLRYQCLLLMDEFTAMGRLPILAKAVGYIAGYNLRLLPVIQSIAQLRSVYGDQDARTFVTNHALQIVFAPRELSDAKEYSEMLGDTTETRESTSRSRSFGGPLMGGHRGNTESVNRSEQRRALLLPQELRELDPEKQIIFLEGTRPILCEKIRYYEDETFRIRLHKPAVVPVLTLPAARTARVVDPASEDPFPSYDRNRATEGEIEAIADYVVHGRGAFGSAGSRPTAAGGGADAVFDTDLLRMTELRMHDDVRAAGASGGVTSNADQVDESETNAIAEQR